MHIAIDFLNKYRPGGPWLLTAVPVAGGSLTTLTFTAKQEDKLEKWLNRIGKNHNLYFSVNPTINLMTKKAKREDMKQVDWLHVDVDPRAGEDIAEEQARILELFRAAKPRPTCVIFSGGGYQGFWKLDEPIIINGDVSLAEDAKRYNMQLEILHGGDNCHNIDRIMRLPGTMNRPNAKKQAKGRVEVMAELLYFDDSVQYPITAFTAAQRVQTPGSITSRTELGNTVVMPQISGNIKRLESVEDLPDSVKPWVKVLIVQGEDPDEPNRFESRSESLFCVCCELVRAGCDAEMIYSVITDPDFKISASVVELGSRAEAYALKQIKSAMEQAEAPELRELNARHAVISSLGSKCLVIAREWDHAFDRTKIIYQSFEAFRNRYMNRNICISPKDEVPPKYMPLGKWWLEHARREQFDTMVFVPGKETPNAFNLWQGFSCEARPGDCSMFLDHIKENICSGDAGHYEYLMKWLASAVQRPDQPAGVAVVLRGLQGTGKGVFSKMVGFLFGQHFLQVTNAKHLTGAFNSHLRDTVMLFADEAFYAGDKKNEAQLKALITEEQMLIEAKGIDVEFGRNYLHIIMASNSEWVIPVGMDDRRFFVLDVSNKHKEDREYFYAIRQQMENGGYEALLHHLMGIDLSGFTFADAPKTEALHDQKRLNLSPEEAWWQDKLQEGRLLDRDEAWTATVPKEELFMDYIEFVKRPGSALYQTRCTKTRMTQFLKHFVPTGFPRQRAMSMSPDSTSKSVGLRFNSKPICYIFPTLQECRDSWDMLMQCKTPWQDVEVSDDAPPF
ncbi:MAG: hypothetical protein GY934_09705 [Gammaproteobacteria bacterium]|nr:hypothetical protein [Gammaproteobacteria bacterium]